MASQVILKMTSKHKQVLRNMRKYYDFMNFVFEKENAMLYIEPIQEGILYIFKDLETLTQLHQPLPPGAMASIGNYSGEEDNFLIAPTITEDRYPKQGMKFYLECDSIKRSVLFPILLGYYHSIHPEISVELASENKILVNFKVFEGLKRYSDLLYEATRQLKASLQQS